MSETNSKLFRFLDRFSLFTGIIGCISLTLSISVSQSMFVLALLSLLIVKLLSRSVGPSPSLSKYSTGFTKLLVAGLLLYASWLLSAVLHSISSMSIQPITALLKSDFKDVWLMFVAVWVYHHSSHTEHRKLVLRAIAIGFLIVILTGLVSAFSPYRLSKLLYHMKHGWEFSAAARLQHPMLTLPFGITLYMPVGMLGTHLAFGAQLGFAIVPLLLFTIDRYIQKPWFRGWSLADWSVLFLLAVAGIVFGLTNARSAVLGVLSALLVGVVFLTYRKWQKKVLRLAWVPFLVIAGFVLLIVNDSSRDFLMQSFGFEQKHSDYQRIMLWSSAIEVAAKNPVFGVGPGMFSDAVVNQMNALSKDRPYLWYLFMQVERGHAHNDLLHHLVTGGVVSALLFLYFWSRVLFLCLGSTLSKFAGGGARLADRILAEFAPFVVFAPLILLIGGLFQCYLLDDQVLLPFWLMVGLTAVASKSDFNYNELGNDYV